MTDRVHSGIGDRFPPEWVIDLLRNTQLANVNRLEPPERLLEKLRLSVYHQRLQATSQCMGAMYDTARRIRDFSEAYPEIAEEAKFLLDFMKVFKPGKKKEKKEPGGEAPQS
uniref:Uncharacterized protein n=1 Tax=Candidatus Kentrum sp. FW TaxID=2126338 RepID=A0A450TT64_9GAMM|nr:MAG: hypothetical protein BECKFW1821B_GA0114236_12361 [Candidatus Kentron sp. FW]